MLFHREYKGALAPWGSTVLARPVPKVKESKRKENLGRKEYVSNANLVSTSSGSIKARTMRRCTPVFDIETMIEACGSPWNHTQKQVVTRKPRKRLPPHRGIEPLPPAPRSPSQQAAIVMPRRQKVMNHHLEMVMMMMMMEMMNTQEKEQREKQQVQLLEEQPVQRNW